MPYSDYENQIRIMSDLAEIKKRLQRLETREVGYISNLSLTPATQYIIAAGIITITYSNIIVRSQVVGVADDLDTINGTRDGQVVVVSLNGTGAVTVKDGTGNLQLNGDFVLNSVRDQIVLINRGGTILNEISRSDNA